MMTRPRDGLRAATLGLSLSVLTGCNQLLPAKITFPHAYVGLTSTMRLHFTLNGTPVVPASMVLADTNSGFVVTPPGPLESGSTITVTPMAEGPLTDTLTVVANGVTTAVPVTANVTEPPACSSPDIECQPPSVDTDSGDCIVTQAPDGAPCSASNCVSQFACLSGHCVASPLAAPVAACVPPGMPATSISPVWRYTTSNFPVGSTFLGSYGVYDSSGNQYLVECTPAATGAAPVCALSAITWAGAVSWSVPLETAATVDAACGQAMVVGDVLVLPVSGTCALQGYALADGSLLWSYSSPSGVYALASIGATGPIALLDTGDPVPQLILLDPTTGMQVAFPTGAPPNGSAFGATVLSDGQGTLWSLGGAVPGMPGTNTETLASYDPASGLTAMFVVSNATIVPELCAVSGTTVVTTAAALSSGMTITGFPSATELGSCDVVTSGPSEWFALTQSLAPACGGAFLDRLSTTSGPTARCIASTGAALLLTTDSDGDGAEFLTALDDGGVGFIMWQSGQASFVVLDSNEQPVDNLRLAGFPGTSEQGIANVALIGHRLVVNVSGGPTLILAYDLPGMTAAVQGWTGLAGGPQRQNSSQ